eukprot:6213096-Pleurochrysis_carterae.AAC.1
MRRVSGRFSRTLNGSMCAALAAGWRGAAVRLSVRAWRSEDRLPLWSAELLGPYELKGTMMYRHWEGRP